MAKVRVNWGTLEDGCVKLHEVRNTSGNGLLVLAVDTRAAMSMAYAANHIYSPQVTIGDPFSRMASEVTFPFGEALKKHWHLIQKAISLQMQGTVHFESDGIAVGYEAVQ